jgi:hypothetical protein
MDQKSEQCGENTPASDPDRVEPQPMAPGPISDRDLGHERPGGAPMSGRPIVHSEADLNAGCCPEVTLRQVADRIKWLYMLHAGQFPAGRPAHLESDPAPIAGWDGNVDARASLRNLIWARIAVPCLRRRVSPKVLIQTAMYDAGEAEYPPSPEEMLLDGKHPELIDRLVQITRQNAHEQRQINHNCFHSISNYNHMKRGHDQREAIRRAIADLANSVGTFHRYWCASHFDIPEEVPRLLAKGAYLEYIDSKEVLDEIYGPLSDPWTLWLFRRNGGAFYRMIDSGQFDP